MKKIISISLLLGAAFTYTACQSEEEDLFNNSAAERLEKSKVAYTQRLPQATGGWAMEFYPTNSGSWPRGNGYLLLAKFNEDKSVRMAMQNDELTDGLYMEDTSLWEVIADQGPVLSFNTYNNCLHSFANPAIYETGLGLEGDYEFEIISLEENAEYAMLKGKKRSTYVRMTRLEDDTDFEEYLSDIRKFQQATFNVDAPNSLYIYFGDQHYIINDVADGFLSFYPEDGDEISQTESHPYLITRKGGEYYLRFRDAFDYSQYNFPSKSLQELRYDATLDMFVGKESPEFIIKGYDPARFFDEYIGKHGSNYFEFNGKMSEKFQTYIDALIADFATMKSSRGRAYSFESLRLQWDNRNESFQWMIRYTPGTTTATSVGYNYSYAQEDDRVKFVYVEPGVDSKGSNAASTNVRNTLPSVVEITELLSQEFIVSPALTSFDLSSLRLTSVSDPDLWFIVSVNSK